MKTLSLVVPTYNAPDLARTLLAQLPVLAETAHAQGFELVETIFVDDGSEIPLADALPNVAQVHVIRHEPNRGKGFSVKEGALAAKGDWVLMSDVDLSAPFAEFARLAPHAAADLVCGSRYGRPGMPLRRRILSRLFHWVVRLAGIRGVQDTQCGFKLFRMAALRAVFNELVIERFAFDVELIRRVQLMGGSVIETPITWQGGHRSSLRVFSDAPRMLWDVFVAARAAGRGRKS